MPEYLVTWKIDVDGKSAKEAAVRALEIQRRVGSEATVFDVQTPGGRTYRVDILEECCCSVHPGGCPGEDCDGCEACPTGRLRREFIARECQG